MLVTVIIPCFNSENTIGNCLRSIFSQRYRQIEVICINDGSSDKTLEKLNELKPSSPFPFTILDQQNKGACSARNEGLKLAKGDYIQFLDADDELKIHKIEDQINYIQEKKEVDLLIAPFERRYCDSDTSIVEIKKEDYWTSLIVGRAGYTTSNLFSRNIVNQIGGWDELMKSSQEAELMFRIFQKSDKVVFFDKVGTVKNELSTSISFTKRDQNWERAILLRMKMWEFLKHEKLLTDAREQGLKQIVFDCTRILYSTNQTKALELYKAYIQGKFKPVTSWATSTLYIFVYSLLGFRFAQKLSSWLK